MSNSKMDAIQVQDAVVAKKWTLSPGFILLGQGLVETAHGAGTRGGSHQFFSDFSHFVGACTADKHFGSRTGLVMTNSSRLAQERVRIGQNGTDSYRRRKRCMMPYEKRFAGESRSPNQSKSQHFCQRFCYLWFIPTISLKHLCLKLPLAISRHGKILDTSCACDEITLVIAIAVAFSVGSAFSPFRSYTLIKLFTHDFFNQHTYCTHSKGTQILTKFLLFRHFVFC